MGRVRRRERRNLQLETLKLSAGLLDRTFRRIVRGARSFEDFPPTLRLSLSLRPFPDSGQARIEVVENDRSRGSPFNKERIVIARRDLLRRRVGLLS